MRKKLTVLVLFCIIILTSCSLTDKLGFDTYDYMSESIVSVHDIHDETAEIYEMLEVLVSDKTVLACLRQYERCHTGIQGRAVLMFMLESGYAKYSGNTELIEKAEKSFIPNTRYPRYSRANLKPMMYLYFGGNVKITHRDGDRFKYLPKVGAYISPSVTESAKPETEITYLAETEKTYRVRFKVCTSKDSEDEEYFALIIKREDGTLYFKKLLKSADVK